MLVIGNQHNPFLMFPNPYLGSFKGLLTMPAND